jgi:hypothetical protein
VKKSFFGTMLFPNFYRASVGFEFPLFAHSFSGNYPTKAAAFEPLRPSGSSDLAQRKWGYKIS